MSLGNPELDALLKKAIAAFDALTPAEKIAHRREQAISFVMGNLRLSGRNVTREVVAASLDEMMAKGEIGVRWGE